MASYTTGPATSRPSYTTRSLVTRVSVTTVLRYFVLIGCSETRTAGARLIGELSAEKHVV